MSEKNEAVIEPTESKLATVVRAVLAGEKTSLAGLSLGDRFFLSELRNEGVRAVFARTHLKRDTLDESRKALSEYMRDIREKLGNPSVEDEVYKIIERVRKALSIALDRLFPEESANRKKRAPRTPERPVQGKAITTGAGEGEEPSSAEVAPEIAIQQLEGNLIAVLDNALKAGAGSKADLAQFAVMTIKQWMK